MPTKTLPQQTGNSCAAHCTAIAINELKGQNLDKKFAEDTLWPSIQFIARDPVTTMLASAHNSDPRLILQEVSRRWPGVTAKLLCDANQKNAAMNFVATAQRAGLTALFTDLTRAAVAAPTQLDEGAFYNCSYTMHSGVNPSDTNFTGLHNILVTYSGGKAWYYNPNESAPSWRTTTDWKTLKSQNNNSSSYVFTGVSVVIH